MNKKVLGIIPARGGSKGVPNKNKFIVNGKPLIKYTIDAALSSTLLDDIVVSSDDDDILDIAKNSGVIAIRRPEEISSDTSPVIECVRHALDSLASQEYDAIVLLQPTSPFRTALHIDESIELYRKYQNSVCSVYQCEDNHPARMYSIKDNSLQPLFPELASIRRQDLPPIYHRNGCIYVFGKDDVIGGQIIREAMTPYIMSTNSSVNIDTIEDMLLFEVLVKRL